MVQDLTFHSSLVVMLSPLLLALEVWSSNLFFEDTLPAHSNVSGKFLVFKCPIFNLYVFSVS